MPKFAHQFKDVFARDSTDDGRVDAVKHYVNTGDAAPIKQKPYNATEVERLTIVRSVKEMLEELPPAPGAVRL